MRLRDSEGFVDLFSGCGGLSLGLRWAGFRPVAAVDVDPLATATYRSNHTDALAVTADIREVEPRRLLKGTGTAAGQLALLAGCPPCQGFSSLRTHRGRIQVEDPSSDLIFEFLRFVEYLMPKTVMFENMPGLLEDARFERFKRIIAELGYRCEFAVLDAWDYGVPQRQRRLVFLGSRVGQLTLGRTQARKTVRETIGDLPKPGWSNDPLHDYSEKRTQRVMDLIRRIPKDGGGRSDLPSELQLPCHRRVDGFYDIYGRMSWRQPAPTITGGCINPSKGRFLHPTQDRAITLREAALLQGFPPEYRFSLAEGRYRLAELIGNAFPPPFARSHATALRNHLRECYP